MIFKNLVDVRSHGKRDVTLEDDFLQITWRTVLQGWDENQFFKDWDIGVLKKACLV